MPVWRWALRDSQASYLCCLELLDLVGASALCTFLAYAATDPSFLELAAMHMEPNMLPLPSLVFNVQSPNLDK